MLRPAFLLVFASVAAAQTIPLDRSVSPCTDFYQYACGTWMKNNPIPPDQSRWDRFEELQERNRKILREILEKYSAAGAQRTPVEQKIGDYYAACMDESAIEKRGTAPIKPMLDRIHALSDKQQLAELIAYLHRSGVHPLFNFGSDQDYKNSDMDIAEVDQGGLGLPERDYYLREDAKSVELRKQYVDHVRNMFRLLGESAANAETSAKQVMDIETALAKGSLDITSRRDPSKVYHKMPEDDLAKLSPSFAWQRYIRDSGAPPFHSLNVTHPEYFRTMQQLIASKPLAEWKSYLTWHVLHDSAPLLPKAFVAENFDFYGKTLSGAKELMPRWKRCVDMTDNELGEALGQKYVERAFGPQAKQHTLAMVQAIERALREDIRNLQWMTPATKKEALIKLDAITNKIGYPDKWRDYSSVKIVRDDPVGNTMRADQFEFQRQLNKIGKPVDKSEWGMTPPTVNAYYDPTMNNINFPAGILQPPFYSEKADDALNYGAIGAVVGHELTHGFDDEGRQFDPKGNLRDWWTSDDAKEFERRAECFVKEYANFVAVDDVKLNGKLTLGENTADNGGLRLAFMALMESLKGKPQPKIDGMTPEQRLFLGWAQVWCMNSTPQSRRMLAQTDPHSPGKYRVNGVLRNMPEFQKAYGCTAQQPMTAPNACRVW